MTRDVTAALAALRVVAAATGGHCDDCVAYLLRRRKVLTAAINATARERQLKPSTLLICYVTATHHRHVAGLPLATEVAP